MGWFGGGLPKHCIHIGRHKHLLLQVKPLAFRIGFVRGQAVLHLMHVVLGLVGGFILPILQPEGHLREFLQLFPVLCEIGVELFRLLLQSIAVASAALKHKVAHTDFTGSAIPRPSDRTSVGRPETEGALPHGAHAKERRR